MYRPRLLPHWRLGAATYYVIWRLAAGQPLLSPHERELVASALRFFDRRRYELVSWVVMDDHVHVLAIPFDDETLEAIVHSWKSFTGNQLARGGRSSPIWQREYFDRIMRDDDELVEKALYIVGNAAKRWPDCKSYAWVYPSEE